MYLSVILYAIGISSVSSSGERGDRDGYGYTYFNDYRASYKIHEPELFEVATLKCQSEGARLLVPDSAGELVAVLTLNYSVDTLFVGLHDRFREGAFRAIDGRSHYFSNWSPGEPTVNDIFAVAHRDVRYEGVRDYAKFNFACRKLAGEKFCLSKNDIDTYVLMDQFKAEYKFHSKADIMTAANLKCLSEGGEVFYPKSLEESQAVWRMIDDVRPDLGINLDRIWIGIQNQFEWGFESINGDKNFYINWKNNGKNNGHTWVALTKEYKMESWAGIENYVCRRYLNQSCSFGTTSWLKHKKLKSEFLYVTDERTHYDANRVCNNYYQGSLAMPNNSQELDLMLDLFRDLNKNFGVTVWVGFHQLLDKDDFSKVYDDTTINGSLFTWADKKYSIMDIGTERGCGSLHRGKLMNIANCGEKHPFICRKDPPKPVWWGEGTAYHRYWFPKIKTEWLIARQHCRDYNMTLAMPQNANESEIIRELMVFNDIDIMFLGYHSKHTESHIVQLKDYGPIPNYLNWKEKPRPDMKFCGGLWLDQTLARCGCDTDRYFVCEDIDYTNNTDTNFE